MNMLVEILKQQTETLKNQFLEMTEKWALQDFENLKKWANDYKLGKFGFGLASKKYHNLPTYIRNSNGKVEQHIEVMLQEANIHYELSVKKLAERVEKKMLNTENLTVKTAHIGVNIETILTDGIKTVKAYTIIAQGEIQKPHYRYLIK